jgi:hypothetical protein
VRFEGMMVIKEGVLRFFGDNSVRFEVVMEIIALDMRF